VYNSFRWESGVPVFYTVNGNKPVDYRHTVWGVTPRNIYQNLVLELFLNPDIFLTTVQSEAGYGKTYLALAAALHLVMEIKSNPYKRIYLVKPVMEVGSKMGYLPGDAEEKMAPYVRYVLDLLLKLHEVRPANRIFEDPEKDTSKLQRKRFQILPLAYIRGMNIEDAVVIVDEIQNLSRTETRSLLTRMGKGVKCFCLGDTRQVDNPYLNESNNGLNWVVKKCKGMKNYAHIVLKGDSSRGPITDMVLKSGL
jgi:PhoH-like ATPase